MSQSKSNSDDGSASVEIEDDEVDYRYRDRDRATAADDVNYSTTRRWKKRCGIWRRYSQQIDNWMNNNDFNSPIPQLQPSKLFFQSDEHPSFEVIAELRVLLTDYKALHDGDLSSMSTATLENSTGEIQALQAEIQTLQAEIQTLQEQLELLTSSEESNRQLIEAIRGRIEDKRGRIEDKRGMIKKQHTIITDKRTIITDKRTIITDKRTIIKKHLEEVATRHDVLRMELDILKERGNENATTTAMPTASIDSKRIDVNKVASPSEMQALVNPIEDAALEETLAEFIDDDDVKANLSKFQKFVADLVETSPAYDKTNSQHTALLDETVKKIIDWEPAKNATNKQDIGSCNLVRPSFDSDDENNVDQPILRAILLRIIKMIGLSNSLTSEQFVPSVKNEAGTSGRRIDLVCHNTRESFSSLLAAMLGRAIELKAVTKNEKVMEKRLKKGENQVLGHLGKQAWFSFDVGGVGENCDAYGITLTMWSVLVEKIELRDVGTVTAKVETKRTQRLRLLGEEYALPDDVKSLLVDGKHNAFIVLAGALKAACSPPGEAALGSIDSQLLEENDGGEEQLETERLLGSGAFSNVLKLKAKGQFLKIPKAAAMIPSVEGEAEVLSQLTGREDIPQLVNENDKKLSKLKFIHNGDVGGFTGLKLKGIVGVTLALCRRYDPVDLASIIHKVFTALEYAHRQGYFHLDVRPENIIVDPSTKEVMLSDWGVASKRGRRQIAFRGCLPYAHDGWFANEKHKAKPNEEYDFASLLYTWMHVAGETLKLPWNDEFQRISRVDEQALKNRKVACKSAFSCDKEDKKGKFYVDGDEPRVPEPAFSSLIKGARLNIRESLRRSAAGAQEDQSDNKRSQEPSSVLVGNETRARNRVSSRRSSVRGQQGQSNKKRSQPSSALEGNAKSGKRRKVGRKG